MTWLDTLTEKALARELPTRAEGAAERTLPEHRPEYRDLVRVRRRGPGTALPANA
jgi:hypothetical protein